VFDHVELIDILDSKDKLNLELLNRPELGVTFTKLHCWKLVQYKKCVFLDADCLVLMNVDDLFERDEFSAAPDVGWPDCFNSGVFVFRPCEERYASLLKFAIETGSFDGGDQGLLNLYFNYWSLSDSSKRLPFIYNMTTNSSYTYAPAFNRYNNYFRSEFLAVQKLLTLMVFVCLC
jgi:glycogenin glucosyltransferase